MALTAATLLVWAMLPPKSGFPAGTTFAPAQVEAARASAAGQLPTEGWQTVTLPDQWMTHWPDFDGRVWYRVHFTVPADWPATRELGLLVNTLNMAGVVTLDGQTLWRDPQLDEPMTRAWNQPRFWRLSTARAPAGSAHELRFEVAGYAAYLSGLGQVWLGDADLLQERYRQEQAMRHDLQLWSLGVTGALGLLFLMLWVSWPGESLYGWFALSVACWSVATYNQVAPSVWPLPDTHGWQLTMAEFLFAFATSFVMFVFRFVGRQNPRTERALAVLQVAVLLAGLAAGYWAPGSLGVALRAALFVGALALVVSVTVYLLCDCWRARTPPGMAMAMALLLPCAAAAHDVALALHWMVGEHYYALSASSLLLLSTAMLLAWRLRDAFERASHFNTALRDQVDAAKASLSEALTREHELALLSARQAERIALVRDLHDGLGGTLLGGIATLEQSPESAPHALAVLGQVRDDLRLVIESSSNDPQAAFAQPFAATRHRLQNQLEARGISAHWVVEGMDELRLARVQSLHLLRLLQEAVTNIVRHSQAHQAWLTLKHQDGVLSLEVRDDGVGFDTAAQPGGIGLDSMRQRAATLGAALTLQSGPGGGTVVALRWRMRGAGS